MVESSSDCARAEIEREERQKIDRIKGLMILFTTKDS
jgi:hypothetical protein